MKMRDYIYRREGETMLHYLFCPGLTMLSGIIIGFIIGYLIIQI